MPDWRGTFNIPAEKCYRAVLNYIRAGSINKKDKIAFSLEPSLIEVKTGIKDGLKIGIIPEGDKSTVLMDFDFGLETAIYLIGGLFLTFLYVSLAGFHPGAGFFTASLIALPLGAALHRENKVRTIYTGRISDLLKYVEQTGVIPEFKEEPKPPVDINALYERLIRTYSAVYGRGARLVDRKIQSYMKTGLSREEAIKKLAEKEGLLERSERERILELTEEKPRPELPPETLHLYQRLIDMYSSVYGRGKPLLEHKIEEYIGKGLSREEAITRLAEEEGIT